MSNKIENFYGWVQQAALIQLSILKPIIQNPTLYLPLGGTLFHKLKGQQFDS